MDSLFRCTGATGRRKMYIDVEVIITAGKVVSAILLLGGAILGIYRWYLKREETATKLSQLEKRHVDDIKKIEEEACLHTYGILACLKGLQEQGCNGPVTEAIDKFETFINKRAHDQEE